jgi:neutral ceramidase
MRQASTFLKNFITVIIIIAIAGCSVVKTPYFNTDYYNNTETRFDSLRPFISLSTDTIYAGFSKKSITPDLNPVKDKKGRTIYPKIPLGGFGQRLGKPAQGIHDSLYVKAITLKTGNQVAVLICVDMLIMPPNIADSVVSRLSAHGIKRDQLFFSATHTHSGTGGWGKGPIARVFSGKENKKIEAMLINQIISAAEESFKNLRASKIGSGSFNGATYTRNRLTGNPNYKNDDFNFISIQQLNGKKSIIGIFSAHATTLGSKNMMFSADYPGYWERKMETTGADYAMFFSGSMANQSPVGKGESYERSRYIGESLADLTSSCIEKTTMEPIVTFSTISLKILLPEYHFRFTKNRNFTRGVSKMLMPLPKNVYLQVLRINKLIWIFTPGDFSGESAVEIKRLLAANGYTGIISGYNGSYIGYINPGKYFYLDNYEVKTMGWFGPTMGDYAMELIDQLCNAVIVLNTPK